MNFDTKTTTKQRFHNRIRRFELNKRSKNVHHFWWFMHNCVAHFLIGVCPIKTFFQFHDYTSDKINGK